MLLFGPETFLRCVNDPWVLCLCGCDHPTTGPVLGRTMSDVVLYCCVLRKRQNIIHHLHVWVLSRQSLSSLSTWAVWAHHVLTALQGERPHGEFSRVTNELSNRGLDLF